MKLISVCHNDVSFKNKFSFKSLLIKAKSLFASLYKNQKKSAILGVLVGSLAVQPYFVVSSAKKIVHYLPFGEVESNYIGTVPTITEDEVPTYLNENEVTFRKGVSKKYYMYNNLIYSKDTKMPVSLENSENPLCLVYCNVNSKTFEGLNLINSRMKQMKLDYSSVTNDCIKYLPRTLEDLSLDKCGYITNLNDLAMQCPNLKTLHINAMASLSDLSFIYELKNLEEIEINDSAYVTSDLINYLNSRKIKHNLTEQDIINGMKVDNIIAGIIKPNMSDREKINTICSYVIDNFEYDENRTHESNANPLDCALKDGKVVCASYAYFTNVLLNKAGIESYEVRNNEHGWNVVKVDDKYYYIDLTNMDADLNTITRDKIIYDLFDYSFWFYMKNPEMNALTMTKATDNRTIMSSEISDDIKNGAIQEELLEKCNLEGNKGWSLGVAISKEIISLSIIKMLLKSLKKKGKLYMPDIKNDYQVELNLNKEKAKIKKL